MTIPTLTSRELGRATLARQHLLRRSDMDPLSMIEHLLGLQAQAPMPPYYALWTRLRGFRPEGLSRLIESRAVVRIVLMRSTVFAVSATDAHALRGWVQPFLERVLDTNAVYASGLDGVDRTSLTAAARELLRDAPRSAQELRPLLSERFPGADPSALAQGVRALLPLVQVPPRGLWGRSGQPRLAMLDDWARLDPAARPPSPDTLILRYLAAFGPASVRDAQAWCGLTRLAEIFERLRPGLAVFRDEHGVELFDLPDAPRPDPATPAPVRILAPFDNVLLSHADRTRIVSEDVRKRVVAQNGIIRPVVLVGGTVAGNAQVKTLEDAAVLEVTTWRRLTASNRSAIEAEGTRLLRFAEPRASAHEVRFVSDAGVRRADSTVEV
ncbi:winged helix DNA-binding domain-containing protein [Rhodococcus chondri]|uniref:Winged helix DNA-binding domain-containing protein n=1 Tax=Rhodococcus chondri TaxID=3065941 RepID=A0ABU7JWQ9_9NOCA|nr:winged helix DNA-binding domain-containing protein [Rhodococcus sp. CC-R104]MEE2033702.1 winged helix DNA-binding domain-containing protein [Rhodococcus sp. CC-R104]